MVEIAAAPGCARCASGKGCGAGVLAGDERLRSVEALIAHGLAVREGDRVSIQLAPKNLLRAALIVYGLPLTGAVVASAAAHLLGASDPAAVAMVLVTQSATGIHQGRRVGQKFKLGHDLVKDLLNFFGALFVTAEFFFGFGNMACHPSEHLFRGFDHFAFAVFFQVASF